MRTKTFAIAALLIAAFFALPFHSTAANATGVDGSEQDESETAEITERTVFGNPPGIPNEAPPETAGQKPIAAARPFTPPGTGTVVDYASDKDGKEFFTITTPDENVFYLVIDRQRGQENVYFLNAVTEADLLPLAQTTRSTAPAYATTEPPSDPAEEEPAAAREPDKGGGAGTIVLVAVLLGIGGGAGWYFKVRRPRHQRTSGGDEYEPDLGDAGEPNEWCTDEYDELGEPGATQEWGGDEDDEPAEPLMRGGESPEDGGE